MKSLVIFIALTGLMSLVGCGNKVNFSAIPTEGSFATPPVVIVPTQPGVETPIVQPLPVEPPVVVTPKPLNMKNGTCAVGSGEKVLSCLDCASTAPVLPPPILSKKAQELLDIMTAACSIENKSDPKGYVAPNYDQLLKRVIQCSPTGYPDTAFLATQGFTINQLLTNLVAQKNAFGGLYYNSASRDFETYFGLDIGEARYTFCRGQASINTNGVYPIEYYDSLYSGQPYTLPSIYVKAQKTRDSLRNCMANSLRNPNVPQNPTVPGVTCSYESAEGEMNQLMVDKIKEWQQQKHVVYFEGFNQCGVLETPEQLLDNDQSEIKIAIKKCQ